MQLNVNGADVEVDDRYSVTSGSSAVANAIASLTGTRIRRLPINKSIRIN
jgi:hypothetical protein